MNATATESSSDWLLDDLPAPHDDDAPEAAGPAPWRILIVDDDVDVHVVTKFSLSNTNFMGRRLSFLHAYSAAEALTVLRNTPDIALVLLDVIMETADAGLLLTRQIREELGNQQVRLILRTGQPGQALEHSIVLDYEINDFWCKTDLTTRKLFTTVISSLRTYASLQQAETRLTTLNAATEKPRQLATALEQHLMLLWFDADGQVNEVNPALADALHSTQLRLQGAPLTAMLAAAPPDAMLATLAERHAWAGPLQLQVADGGVRAVLATITPLQRNAHDDGAQRYLAILAG